MTNDPNKNPEPTGFSELVSRQLTSSQKETARTIQKKSEASGQRHLIEPSRQQLQILINHFHSIGADRQLLSDDAEKNRALFVKWFQTLVIRNDRFPTDLPVVFVLEEFFEAILQRKVPLKGYNLLTHTSAFHEWIGNFEHQLKATFWHRQHPATRPKALPETGSFSEAAQQQSAEQRKKNMEKLYKGKIPEGLKKYLDS